MFSGAYQYPYETFRADLRALPEIMAQNKILRMSGEVWDAHDFEDTPQEMDIKIGSYFLRRYSDHSQVLECSGILSMTIREIAAHIDQYAPGYDINDLAESGFAQASEPLLKATHAMHTEVNMFEWGDGDEAFEFLLEIARSRFGYDG